VQTARRQYANGEHFFRLARQASRLEPADARSARVALDGGASELAVVACAGRAARERVASILLLAAAFGAYFMGSYGVVLDTTMIVNVLQTDPREVRDLMSMRLLGSVFVMAILPMIVLWWVPVQRKPLLRQLGRNVAGIVTSLVVLALLTFLLFADLSATMRNHKSIRYLINPVNSLYALVDIGIGQNAKPSGPPLPIGLDAKIITRAVGAKPPLLLLVVGETGRADHFGLNGYPRPTNPELSKLDVVSFAQVTSCGTNTAASLPCMFSSLGKAKFESRDKQYENLRDLVQRAGMAVLWVDNQAGCKGLCERVPHAQAGDAIAGSAEQAGALCHAGNPSPKSDEEGDGECFDQALLSGLDARLAALPAAARDRGVLIVLHQMGSHGPAYYKRSPPDRKPFLPECTTNSLQQCDHAALINGYDNSIAYTDHMLAQSVQWLKQHEAQYDPSMYYVSDHGESLGENGIYLHGLPYSIAPREQTHVPMVVWLSPGAQANGGPSIACLDARRDTPLSHDNLFHSALGLLGIQAAEYKPALDALAACRKP
jgi:lipid A ethanolaminephosphotransferase